MPKVGKKTFSYNASGMRAAKKEAIKKGVKMSMKKTMKKKK
jgi:hypothetical protein|tara:strand:- start:1705 stop:1827 length:123 start_codon:yes stop_codon:yes gene_type:complete